MWWGYSPALDLLSEISAFGNLSDKTSINILIVNSSDARHIIKTISLLYTHKNQINITFHVIESSLEQIARSIFLLSICLEKELGLQEATRYYLEILGNTLLRPATAKYLISRAKRLVDVITDSLHCDWLDLKELKYKERDVLAVIFQFWAKAASTNIPTSQYFDLRVRQLLGTRYDYKNGAFDWDYFMVLKPRNEKIVSSYDYKFWRDKGVAFTWLEGEPVRGNPTLLASDQRSRLVFTGDVRNGPFFIWTNDENESNKDLRAADIAEKQVMRAIYGIHNQLPMNDDNFAAHRDSSILNGTIVVELAESNSEQECWSESDILKQRKDIVNWVDIPQVKVVFHPIDALQKFSERNKYNRLFDCVWISQQATDEIPTVARFLKPDGLLLAETRKFMTDFRDEKVQEFIRDVRNIAKEYAFTEIEQANEMCCTLRFCIQ